MEEKRLECLMMLQIHRSDTPSIDTVIDLFATTAARRLSPNFYWSFTSLVHFWPPSILNRGYAYGSVADYRKTNVHSPGQTVRPAAQVPVTNRKSTLSFAICWLSPSTEDSGVLMCQPRKLIV